MTEAGPVAVLSQTDAQRSAEAILLIAERLADPVKVMEVVSRQPDAYRTLWHPLSLSRGLPGAAALYLELAKFDDRWLAVAHQHLRYAAQALEGKASHGLYLGPAALLHTAQSSPGHYPKLRRALATWLAQDQAERISAFLARDAIGVSCSDYDLISGVTGTLTVLISSLEDPTEASSAVESAVHKTLRWLVRLSEPIRVDGNEVPGWWAPPQSQPPGRRSLRATQRDFDLGMAHGVSGPLTLLSLALRRGHEVPGQRNAIRTFADWLARWALRDDTGIYWPATLSWDQQAGVDSPPSGPTRTAWCYGTPGVAYALAQAAVALDVPTWRQLALTGLRDILKRSDAAWLLTGPTICHGYAGLLQTLWRAWWVTGDDKLLDGCRHAAEVVMGFADPNREFVFPHLGPAPSRDQGNTNGHHEFDVPGILEGATGVACALLSITPPHLLTPHATESATAASRSWDRCLALSDLPGHDRGAVHGVRANTSLT